MSLLRTSPLVLKGKRNLLDCSGYINNWDSVLNYQNLKMDSLNPDESFHSVLQGRLIEIGNIRNYKTYSPDKSRTFNKKN